MNQFRFAIFFRLLGGFVPIGIDLLIVGIDTGPAIIMRLCLALTRTAFEPVYSPRRRRLRDTVLARTNNYFVEPTTLQFALDMIVYAGFNALTYTCAMLIMGDNLFWSFVAVCTVFFTSLVPGMGYAVGLNQMENDETRP